MKRPFLQIAPYIAIIVLIGFMLFQSYENRREDDKVTAANKLEVKRLELLAAEKDSRIITLEFDKAELEKIIGSINTQLDQINNEKLNLIQKRDEKINIINTYDSVQLQQFFTDNYPN